MRIVPALRAPGAAVPAARAADAAPSSAGPLPSPPHGPGAAEGQAAPRLPRELGVWSAGAVLVGSTIGSGIFRVPAEVAGAVPGPATFMLVWAAGALFTLCGALTLAELAAAYPRTGGVYVYLREAFGPACAFLFGWSQLVVIRPSALGAIALIFASYAGTFLPLGEGQVRALAAAAIVVVGLVNVWALRWGALLENLTTWPKAVALVAVATAAFLVAPGADAAAGVGATPPPVTYPSTLTWAVFGTALVGVLWAYDGWADLTYIAGEVRDPGRVLPLALVGGVLVVAAIYLGLNAAYLRLLDHGELAAADLVAADAATRVVGAAGAGLVSGLVVLSTFGALNGAMMTGPRIFFAMARDDLMFRPVAAVHPRYRTPWVAILLATALGVAFVSVRTFEQLAGAFILGVWPFYALAVAAALRLRVTRPALARPYGTPGYPAVPVLFLVGSLVMLGAALVTQTAVALLSFGIIAAGVPVYAAWRVWRGRRPAPVVR